MREKIEILMLMREALSPFFFFLEDETPAKCWQRSHFRFPTNVAASGRKANPAVLLPVHQGSSW